jgi:hypothetical protein
VIAAWALAPEHTVAVIGGMLAVGILLWGIGRELSRYEEERRKPW